MDISKTDITGDTELVGVKLQVLNSKEEVLDEWISDGTEHRIEYLPVGEELTLRENPDNFWIHAGGGCEVYFRGYG